MTADKADMPASAATGGLTPAPVRGPIFPVGAMGSGTTLLRLMLDSHENIAIPRETGFMRAYNAHQYIPYKWSGRGWAKRMGWSYDELDAELRVFYDKIFRRHVEARGAKRWGDKTPLHTFHIDDMARVFPDCVFVGIVRHPGGGVSSNMRRFSKTRKQAVSHYRRYSRELARQAVRYPERFALMRYEDLVLQPEATMRQLLAWLGEPWSPSVLEHHVVQVERNVKQTVEGRSRIEDPIDASRIAAWTATIAPADRRYVEARLRSLGSFYGYDVADPLTMAPLRGDGLLVTNGVEIAERVERYPELDLHAANTPALGDQFLDPRKVTVQPVAAPRPVRASSSQSLLKETLLPTWRRLPPETRDRVRVVARPLLRRARRRTSG